MPADSLKPSDLLLGQFDEALRPEIIEFGKRIRKISNEVDVVIFMARKAVCFAEALRLLRLTSFHSSVASQRVLDMNPEWLKGKKVAIFDDALITGTTLHRTTKSLQELGAKTQTHVFCVNNTWWSNKLVQPDGPYLGLPDDQTAIFCARIVDAISLLPLPYSTDYPLFANITLTETDLTGIAASGRWEIDDVSTPLQTRNNVFSRTLTPTPGTLQEIDDQLNWDLSTAALIKVRLYGRQLHSSPIKYWCNAIPIVAFDRITPKGVRELFQSTANVIKDLIPNISSYFTNSDPKKVLKAKIRFLQYLAGLEVAQAWIRSFPSIDSFRQNLAPEATSLAYLFPAPLAEKLAEIYTEGMPLFGQCPAFAAFSPPKPSPTQHQEPVRSEPWSIQRHLTAPFIDLYRETEIRARKLALKHGDKLFSDSVLKKRYQGKIDRLQNGYSLTVLRERLSSIKGNQAFRNRLLSLFLDKAIDLGIVVPTTTVSQTAVFRSYRHGEDVVFGDDEVRLTAHLLREYFEHRNLRNRDYISQIEIEKLIVLFFRIGLNQVLLRRPPTGVLGAPGTAGIRFSLHGAVAETHSNKLYTTVDDSSVTDILEDAKVLRRAPKPKKWTGNAPFQLDEFDLLADHPCDPKDAAAVSNIAATIAEVRNRGTDRNQPGGLLEDDMILLASCLYERDLAGALAAEISWIDRKYPSIRAQVSGIKITSANKKHRYSIASHLRDGARNYVPVAIHSGIWKYQNFLVERPRKIVSQIERDLSRNRNDSLILNLWRQYWPHMPEREGHHSPLRPLIEQQALWLFQFRYWYTLLEVSLLYDIDEEARLTKAVDTANDAAKGIIKIDKEVPASSGIEILITKGLTAANADASKKLSLKQIQRLQIEAQDLLSQTDIQAGRYGENSPLWRFDHALALYIDTAENNRPRALEGIRNRISDFVEHFYRSQNREIASEWIQVVPDSDGDKDYFLLLGYSKAALNALWKLGMEVMKEFAETTGARAILLRDLRPHMQVTCERGTNRYIGGLFFRILNELRGFCLHSDSVGWIFDVHFKKQKLGRRLYQELILTLGKLFQPAEPANVTMEIEALAGASASIDQYTLHPSYRTMKNNMNDPEFRVDIGLVAIVSDEMRAVVEKLKERPGYLPPEDYTSKRVARDFHLGTLPALSGEHSFACVQSVDQGNQSIVAASYDLLAEFRPRLLVILGIGGGMAEDLKICDVCIANSVIDYDTRADTPEGKKHAPIPVPPLEPWLKNLYLRFENEYGERPKLSAHKLTGRKYYRVFLGPIGSGAAVIKDENAEAREYLTAVTRKILDVDTEALGGAKAYDESKLQHGSRTRGYLVIRGISDLADVDKNDKYRYAATANAFDFLMALTAKAKPDFSDVLPRVNE